jgi:hypothetical protein
MGSWSDEVAEPVVLEHVLGRFLQYRVRLSSTLPHASPIVTGVTLSFDWDESEGRELPVGVR